MPDVEDFDNFFGGTVHNDVRRTNEFARSSHLAAPAKVGEGRELFNPFDNRLSNIPGSGRIVLLDVSNSLFQLAGRFGCPPNEPHE